MRIKDLFLDFVDSNGKRWERTPMQIIEALHDACEEMNYSNYHNGLFAKAEEIIRRYCEEHKIKLGPTRETLKKKEQRQAKLDHEKRLRYLLSEISESEQLQWLKGLEKYNHGS